ncbi:MAG TPA: 2Fe-2S iron-sulfur cluster-binding protein [Pyrinomonadaceae bacterium]|jgi:predicted molibdopterin-dependent oxidoreductase YjgC|nr:2Fe-2S iron-sulfur cluster-binding protein [Pyrinomonadaceae bacterium]
MEKYDLRDVLAPYEKLIEIDICDASHLVPENNTLLRCFQFLATENISYGDFCWNGECVNCQVWLQNGDKEKAVMACRTTVAEGMKIVRISEGIDLEP